ncbi:MAG: SRPBCC family protein [Chloroflexota bacterium]
MSTMTMEITERGFIVTDTFDAPAELVFDAWTKCEHLAEWMGPREHQMVTCEIDLKVGGSYRWVWRGPDGSEMPLAGEFREVERPSRLVSTERWDVEPYRDTVMLNTLTLTEENGVTRLVSRTEFESVEARDAALATPMEEGMRQGMEQLKEYLASISAPA